MNLRLVVAAAACCAASACSSGGSEPLQPPPNPEPNDTIAQATPLATDVLAGASMSSPLDVDYYAVAVPAGGAYVRVQTFDASGVACGEVDTYAELYDGAGNLLAWDDDGGPAYCSDLAIWRPAGTSFVAIWHGGAAPAAFAYTLRVTLTAWSGATELEPNGTIATANGQLAADAVVAGAISPTGDYDYWALQNPSAASRVVYLETFENAVGTCPSADSTLAIYDGYGAQLAYDDDGGLNYCSYVSYTIPAYTTYYVRVGGYGGDTFSYLLDVSFY